MTELYSPMLASLPLLLWKTPPGLELILAQEGIAVRDGQGCSSLRHSARAGSSSSTVEPSDAGSLRQPADSGPRLDRRRQSARWRADRSIRGAGRPANRAGVLDASALDGFGAGVAVSQGLDSPRLDRPGCGSRSRRLAASGSGWLRFRTRIARRSASAPTSMSRCPKITIASPRPERPLVDCCTHFVSTYAYTHQAAGLERSEATRHAIARPLPSCLSRSRGQSAEPGTRPPHPAQLGFRAGGIRRPARPVECRASTTSSRILATSIRPTSSSATTTSRSSPGRGDRFSRVLQIPVHPVCEGLFLDAGVDDPGRSATISAGSSRRRLDAGELGRRLWASRAPAGQDAGDPDACIGERSRTSRWSGGRRSPSWRDGGAGGPSAGGWSCPAKVNRFEIQFDEWDREYALRWRSTAGRFQCSLPVTGPADVTGAWRSGLRAARTERSPVRSARDRTGRHESQARRSAALDWETVTPLDEISAVVAPEPRQAGAAMVETQATRELRHDAIWRRVPQVGRFRTMIVAASRAAGATVPPGRFCCTRPRSRSRRPAAAKTNWSRPAGTSKRSGVPVRLFSPWTDRLETARLLHLFGMSREGLELARWRRARGIPVVLSPICWFEPRALAALERQPGCGSSAAWRPGPARCSCRRSRAGGGSCLRLADRVLPNSRAEASQLVRSSGSTRERIRVVPNGVLPRVQVGLARALSASGSATRRSSSSWDGSSRARTRWG